jgi:hypothetical protein
MDDYLRMIIMAKENEHLRVMRTERIRDVRMMELNVGITLCRLLDLGQHTISFAVD